MDGVSCAVAPPRWLDDTLPRELVLQHEEGIHAHGVLGEDGQAEECVAQEEHAVLRLRSSTPLDAYDGVSTRCAHSQKFL